MAFIIKDRVKENTVTTGTGAVSLGGSAATFDPFNSYMVNGDTTYYAIVHTASGTDEWEVGLGTWSTGNTLTRTTVLAGSNGTSAENFSAGTKDVFMTYPASKAAIAGEDVTFADITVTGTVDGRDVAADGTKLDGIDTSADVTDATTVAAAGALMKSGGTMTGNLILNADPTAALGAATKEYVDTIASAGIHYHDPVRVETPSALTSSYNNGSSGVGATLTNSGTQAALVIDGVTMALNDRVLVYNQTNEAHNGIYTVTNVGSASTNWVMTRATDADSYGASDPDSFGKGDAFFVKEGNTGAGELYVMTTAGTITFGTTAIHFSQVAETAVYNAGTGVTLNGTTFSIGQDVGTAANVTFNQVTAAIIGNVTGNLTGDVTGNAGTATALATARTIQLTGDVTGSATFDGSANASITAVVQDDSHSHVISNVDGLQAALDGKTPTTRVIGSGNGLTGGGNLTANRTLNVGAGSGITVTADAVSHADTSSQGSSNNSGRTYIQDVTLDTFGHVTGLATATETVTDTTYSAGSGLSLSGTTFSHSDTSSQGSVNNSSGTVIQDITLDTYGHITGINSVNLDGRYYTESEINTRMEYTLYNPQTLTSSNDLNSISHRGWYGWGSSDPTNAPADYGMLIDGKDGSQPQQLVQTYGGSSNKVSLYGRRRTSGNWDTTWTQYFSDHYHPNADKWTTARTLTLSGDASGSVSWDGSANATLSVTVNNDSHTHDGRYYTETEADSRFVNTSGDTMTGRLVLPDAGYSIGNEYHTWKRSYNVSASSPQELLYHDGTSLPSGGVYRFHAHISGTSTDQSATAVYWNRNGTWKVNVTYQSGTTSNHPEFIIGGSPEKPQIHIDHTGTYSIMVLAERLELSEGSGTDNQSGFGTDAFLGSVGGTLRYNNGGGVNNYAQGNVVFHDGYHPNADKWTTARTLTLSGDASGSVSWDGSANATLSVTVANDSHTHDGRYYTESEADSRFVNVTGNTMSGSLSMGDNNVTDIGKLNFENHEGTDYGVTGDVMFDENFYADAEYGAAWSSSNGGGLAVYNEDGWGRILTDRNIQWHTATFHGLKVGSNTVFHDGYHPNADKWTTARTLSLSGDASGSVSWDGSANATLSVTVANDSHTHDGRYYTESEADSRFVNVTGDSFSGTLTYTGTGVALDTGGDNISLGNMQIVGTNGTNGWASQPGIYLPSSDDFRIHASGGDATLYVDGEIYAGAGAATQKVFHDGYHPNADKWTTARTLSLSGDASGSVSWDGSANATLSVTVNNDSHNHDGRYYTESEADSRFVRTADVFSTSTQFPFKAKKLTGSGIGSSYDERVVLLIPYVTTNTSSHNKCVGKLTASKTGGNVWDSFDISVQSVYNSTTANFIGMGQRKGHKFVTCDYNGVTWVAIKFQLTNNPYNNLWFHGQHVTNNLDTNGDGLKVISYYDTQNGGTIVNSEIYNSISDFNMQTSQLNYNGHTIWNGGNDGSGSGLDADLLDGVQGSSFLRSDADDTVAAGVTYTWSDTDTHGLQFTNSSYGTQLRIGGWTTSNDNNISRIRTSSGNLHMDSAANGNMYLNWYTAGTIQVGSLLNMDGNNITGVTDLYVADQIIHTGDTNTYMQFHATDQWRVVTGGTERLEVNNSAVTIAGVLNVRNAIDLADNDVLRMGSGDDWELFCNGTHAYMDLNSGIGNLYIRDGSTIRYTFNDNGSFTATGNITAYSDQRLKENVKPIPDALEKVKQLRGVTFDWIETGEHSVGVIAQEVEAVLPELVLTDTESEDREFDTKSVDYGKLTSLLIEAIKEQQTQIDELKARLEA